MLFFSKISMHELYCLFSTHRVTWYLCNGRQMLYVNGAWIAGTIVGGVGLSPTRARPVDSGEDHDESNERMVRGSPTANTSGMSFNILKSPPMLVFNFPTIVKKSSLE